MTVDELINAVNAELVANKAIARVGEDRVIVAHVVGDKMVLTAAGEEMAKIVKPAPAPKAEAPKPKTPKASPKPKFKQ